MQSNNLDKPQSDLPATPKGPKGVKGPNHVQPTETSEGKVSKAMKCSSVTKQDSSIFQPPAKHQHPNRAAMAQK